MLINVNLFVRYINAIYIRYMKTIKEYKTQLEQAINTHGYWSEQVQELNNLCIELFDYSKYIKAQNEVKLKLNKMKDIEKALKIIDENNLLSLESFSPSQILILDLYKRAKRIYKYKDNTITFTTLKGGFNSLTVEQRSLKDIFILLYLNDVCCMCFEQIIETMKPHYNNDKIRINK